MANLVPKWVSDDGVLFDTEKEADEHSLASYIHKRLFLSRPSSEKNYLDVSREILLDLIKICDISLKK